MSPYIHRKIALNLLRDICDSCANIFSSFVGFWAHFFKHRSTQSIFAKSHTKLQNQLSTQEHYLLCHHTFIKYKNGAFGAWVFIAGWVPWVRMPQLTSAREYCAFGGKTLSFSSGHTLNTSEHTISNLIRYYLHLFMRVCVWNWERDGVERESSLSILSQRNDFMNNSNRHQLQRDIYRCTRWLEYRMRIALPVPDAEFDYTTLLKQINGIYWRRATLLACKTLSSLLV